MTKRVSEEKLADDIRRLLSSYVEDGKIAGAAAVVAGPEPPDGDGPSEGDPEIAVAVGRRDLESGAPMTLDTLFRIYSLTKPVTSVAALMLVEEGRLSLDDPVADYIPAFGDVQVWTGGVGRAFATEPPTPPPTVRDLLLHTSGIAGTHMAPSGPLAAAYREAQLDDRRQTLAELADKLAAIPLLFQPGQNWRYGISTDVLARVVEVASGRSFGRFLEERLFHPLGMHDTAFSVPERECHRLATVYGPGAGGRLRPLDALGAGEYCHRPALEAGSSGLVSTPTDYLRFARMLLGKGKGRGRRLLHPETVQALATNALPDRLLPYRLPWAHAGRFTAGAGFGLGVRVLLRPEEADVPGSPGEYGWAGAANTFLWIDPVRELVLLLFTQAFPFLHTDMDAAFKRLVYDSLPEA